MPTFHLHQRRGCKVIPDEEGAEFPDFEHARAEALAGARELIAEMALKGSVDLTPVFEIVDENGASVPVPFTDAIDLTLP